MYFMFKPKGENSEWIPLKVVRWTWDGQCAWDEWKEEWKISNGKIAPEKPEPEDTPEYPEWEEGKNAGNLQVWDCWKE